MIHYILLISRQGKVRLSKWYNTMTNKERQRAVRDACSIAIGRSVRLTNFVEHQGQRIVCRRYASLHFVACVDKDDNELLTLEIIHHFVEALDKYFDNVCELDLIFNFHRAFYILDEVILAGELQETSKRNILKTIAAQEALTEEQSKSME